MFKRFSYLKIPGFFSILSILFITTGCTTSSEKPAGQSPVMENPVELPVEEAEEPSLVEKLSALQSVEDTDKALEVLEDSSEELSIEERIIMAALQVAEGSYGKAEEVLDGVLSEEPENAQALYTYALLYDARGEEAERDATLRLVLELDPSHIDANVFQGMVLLESREYEKGGSCFTRVLKTQPDNFLALSGAAISEMNLDRLESAVSLLDRAIELEPDYAYLYIDLARVYKGLKKYGKAEDSISQAIELEPDVEWHYLDRARVRIQYLYDLEGAMEDLTDLAAINPDNFFANVYIAGILDDWDRFDEAETYYQKVIAARPAYGFAHEPLGKIAYMKGQYAEAKDHFLQAFDFEPRDFSYILAASVCLEKIGDRKTAEAILKEVAPRVPRETLEYEMFRYYLSPGSDFFITDKIRKEENKDLQSRMFFYLGARYDLAGLRKSALAVYDQVMKKSEFYESDLAAWELEQLQY